jgi:outer membrane biosynthesis protein TonB
MKNQEQTQFQGALILSTLLHLFIVGLFYFGLPFVFEQLPEEKEVMTFEVVSISEITNIKTENQSKQEEKIAKKSKQVKSAKPTPKEKTPPTKKPVKKEETKKKKEVVPVKKKEKPKKTPPKKKEIQKVVEDPMDSILKNLEKESKGADAKTPTKSHEAQKQGIKTSRGAEYDEESPLSITEKLLVKGQIEKNWRPPVGSESLAEVRVLLHMTLEKNGEIKTVTVKNIICPSNSNTTCKLTAESVIRAVRKSSPIENLPPERYNTLRTFDLIFDPSLIAQ